MPAAPAKTRSPKRSTRSTRSSRSTPAKKAVAPEVARQTKLRAAARDAEADWFLVTDPNDVAYLTGFLGGDSYLLIPAKGTRGKGVVISDFRYWEELEPLKPRLKVHIRTGSFAAALRELFGDLDVRRCAVQAEHLTVAERRVLAKAVGSRKLADTIGVVKRLRERKDAAEVAMIRKAIRVQEAALEALLPTIKPGQTELEVCARLEHEMKARGSSEPGFTTIVAARANGSFPHYRPAKVKLAKNQPLLIDWGAKVNGYHGDMTRTFSLGKWPAKVREIYGIVLESHLAAVAALRPGVTTREVDAASRDVITKAGYGDMYGHGLGHGLGLEIHEDPRMNPLYEPTPIEEGMVVTIEPGIYLPGIGGVRIEDDFVVTATGSKNLCTLPKTIEWSTL